MFTICLLLSNILSQSSAPFGLPAVEQEIEGIYNEEKEVIEGSLLYINELLEDIKKEVISKENNEKSGIRWEKIENVIPLVKRELKHRYLIHLESMEKMYASARHFVFVFVTDLLKILNYKGYHYIDIFVSAVNLTTRSLFLKGELDMFGHPLKYSLKNIAAYLDTVKSMVVRELAIKAYEDLTVNIRNISRKITKLMYNLDYIYSDHEQRRMLQFLVDLINYQEGETGTREEQAMNILIDDSIHDIIIKPFRRLGITTRGYIIDSMNAILGEGYVGPDELRSGNENILKSSDCKSKLHVKLVNFKIDLDVDKNDK